jgi:hypothetical protein
MHQPTFVSFKDPANQYITQHVNNQQDNKPFHQRKGALNLVKEILNLQFRL